MNTKIYKRNILNLNKKDDNGNTLPDATEYRVRDVLEDCGVLYHEVFDGNKRKPYAYGATYKGITTIIYYKSWYADITSVIYNHKEATGKGLTVSIIDRYAELKLI